MLGVAAYLRPLPSPSSTNTTTTTTTTTTTSTSCSSSSSSCYRNRNRNRNRHTNTNTNTNRTTSRNRDGNIGIRCCLRRYTSSSSSSRQSSSIRRWVLPSADLKSEAPPELQPSHSPSSFDSDSDSDSDLDTNKKSNSSNTFPKRWFIVLLCFSAFLLCNMDRVNMSIAILPMSAEYSWSPATVGLVQSSFFWGYLLTQIAGGIWADTVGGKTVLGFGVIWWSIATALTPVAAKLGLPFLLVVRAFMGIGEGVAMPAMNNILSKWIPVDERSRSLALVYSGMYLGSVTGLAFSPLLIHNYGWPSVFYSFGSLGTVWFALWYSKAYSSPLEDPGLSAEEKHLITTKSAIKEPVTSIPWGLILSQPPVWALIVCHFCHNWGTFILLTWMPTYYNQVLKFNLTESGLFCVLPWLTMAFSANMGGWIADTLISKGFSVTTVRKVMQSIGFLGPAFFLTQLSHVHSPAMAVLCMACSQGTDAFSQSGLYSNHQDIGPRYAGVLLGLSNTAGVMAGVLGTAATGYILQHGTNHTISLCNESNSAIRLKNNDSLDPLLIIPDQCMYVESASSEVTQILSLDPHRPISIQTNWFEVEYTVLL